MAIVVRCPGCAKSYRITAEALGRRLQCRSCGQMFEASVPAEEGAAAATASAPSKPAGNYLEVRHVNGTTVVRVLAARINSDNVEVIGAALLALADDPANCRMILNFSQVEFLFSTALGKIVALEKKLQGQRGSLRLCELRPLVRESLESAGLTVILQVFDTEEQALAAKR
jgi:anti-anti-sigma factor